MLKGASLNIGANALAKLATQMERKGASGALDDCDDLLARVRDEFERVHAQLASHARQI